MPNRIFVVVVGTVALVGCGGGEAEAPALDDPPENALHYACDNRAIENTCFDFRDGTTKSDTANACDGRVLGSKCPSDGAIATCTVILDGGAMTNIYYAGGPENWTPSRIADTCTRVFGGTYEKL